jgi:hypothetical protein
MVSKMKQCLGKFHYCSTNKMTEMGEERRKVKSIYVLRTRAQAGNSK